MQRRFWRLGLLDVGGVFAGITTQNSIFTAAREHVKLVGEGAADGAAISLHGSEFNAEPRENPLVGFEHHPVLAIRVGVVHVE